MRDGRMRMQGYSNEGLPRIRAALLAGTAILISAIPAAAAERGASLEEITVTAQRREQSVTDIPLSITAFSGAMLEAAQITRAEEYFARTPNIYITSGASRTGNVSQSELSLAIRGISDVGGTANSFGIYLDDINVNRASVNPHLVDLERIEVLRGPQGTFFGRNAEAGVISLTTKKPINATKAEASFGYSSFSTWDVTGMANAPIAGDKLMLRVAAKADGSDGQLKNTNAVGGNNGYRDEYARLLLRAQPSDRFTADFGVSYTHAKQNDFGLVSTGVLGGLANDICGVVPLRCPIDTNIGLFPNNKTKYNHDAPLKVRDEYWIFNNKLAYQAEGVTLTSVTGYLTTKFHRAGELDFASLDVLREAYDNRRKTSFSQEFRVQSTGTGAFQWIFGGVYARDSEKKNEEIAFGKISGGFGVPEGFSIETSRSSLNIRTLAAFAEGTYNFSPDFWITAGGRVSRDELKQSITQSDFGGPFLGGLGKLSSTDFSPHASVSYRLNPDVITYASVSKGWKGGGFQLKPGGVPDFFGDEQLWNYEVGAKTKLLDNRLQINLSAFYIDWQDVQVAASVLSLNNGIPVSNRRISNDAQASSRGIELEIRARPTQQWDLGFNVGYTKARFDEFKHADTSVSHDMDMSGAPLPKAPKLTFSTNAQYNFPVFGNFEGFVRAEYTHSSKTYTNVNGVAEALYNKKKFPFEIPALDKVNFRAGVEHENYRVVVYVDNAFKQGSAYTSVYDFGFLNGAGVLPVARTVGVKLTARY